jgi:hypothetical protein
MKMLNILSVAPRSKAVSRACSPVLCMQVPTASLVEKFGSVSATITLYALLPLLAYNVPLVICLMPPDRWYKASMGPYFGRWLPLLLVTQCACFARICFLMIVMNAPPYMTLPEFYWVRAWCLMVQCACYLMGVLIQQSWLERDRHCLATLPFVSKHSTTNFILIARQSARCTIETITLPHSVADYGRNAERRWNCLQPPLRH